jgi:hypothetical protein
MYNKSLSLSRSLSLSLSLSPAGIWAHPGLLLFITAVPNTLKSVRVGWDREEPGTLTQGGDPFSLVPSFGNRTPNSRLAVASPTTSPTTQRGPGIWSPPRAGRGSVQFSSLPTSVHFRPPLHCFRIFFLCHVFYKGAHKLGVWELLPGNISRAPERLRARRTEDNPCLAARGC